MMMAKKKAQPKSPLIGHWRILSMSGWDDDYLDEEVQAFIKFEDKGRGSFQFGYVQGRIDARMTTREGKPAMEFFLMGRW